MGPNQAFQPSFLGTKEQKQVYQAVLGTSMELRVAHMTATPLFSAPAPQS